MTKKKIDFSVNPLLGGPSFEARTKSGSPYRELNLSEIDVDPDQPRRVFAEDSLRELADSIKIYGVLNPILVRVGAGGSYRIVAGERRYRAAKLAGLETIPAIVDAEDSTSSGSANSNILSKQLVENIQREDLSPMEKAFAIGQLRDQFSLSVRDIAIQLGISKSSVQRSIDILSLSEDLQAALIAGAPESKILLLAEIKDKKLRTALLAELGNYTRSELKLKIEELLQGLNSLSHGGTNHSPQAFQHLSEEDKRIVEDLQRALGTKVSLNRKGEKGRLIIDFYSKDDLQAVFSKLTS